MENESAASRFTRKWTSIRDDRKVRGWDSRPAERKDREFVDSTPAVEPSERVAWSGSMIVKPYGSTVDLPLITENVSGYDFGIFSPFISVPDLTLTNCSVPGIMPPYATEEPTKAYVATLVNCTITGFSLYGCTVINGNFTEVNAILKNLHDTQPEMYTKDLVKSQLNSIREFQMIEVGGNFLTEADVDSW
ncbi:hypothetical protein SEA_WEASELS2_66 [Rhodococcus phage Weasels2]|uniref:Uncharacterized protein n=1 Tax=Rhodococcus phage Weasels2 TaxID=1897437 RepID=A0A1I9SA49_9CAUD|nr:hypothetical protein FDH04_gp066 [Rhodococcus phage Weasels2]AOZ63655.1 hypothetical protein SEA_WEASELS2_66 [Rhodococcus phage Weasels2]